MNNTQINFSDRYYLLTDIESFKQSAKNHLIGYTNTNHSNSYGLVFNILYKEMNDLIDNIKTVTDDKMLLKCSYIYIEKNCEINFKNIDKLYPEPVQNAFNNSVNYFLKFENI
jgi:hypothetical protein